MNSGAYLNDDKKKSAGILIENLHPQDKIVLLHSQSERDWASS
jgi:hypothetical protein